MKYVAAVVLMLLALGACIVYWQYQSDLDDARARLLAGSRIANTACGPIEYSLAGSGPAVLAIHGAGGGYSQVSAFGRALEAAGFQVIAMSRFGYLRTPMPADASPAAQADAHACLLDALRVRAAAVLGASAGAPSAMQFCLRHRARCSALVLLVPAAYAEGRNPGNTTPPSRFMQLVIDHVLTSDFIMWVVTRIAPGILIETALATPIEDFRRADPGEQQRALNIIRDIFPVRPKIQGLRNDQAVTSSLPRFHLEDIAVPTLVVSVETDLYGTFAGAKYTAKHIRGAHLVTYPTGGHVWLGHDAEVVKEVVAFLAKRR